MRKAHAVDTNLLVLLVVGRTDPEFIERHRRLSEYKTRHYRILVDFLAKGGGIVCTPHILTETSNLLRQVKDPERSRIMATFRKFIEGAVERHRPSRDLSVHPDFPVLGLTDVAILDLDPTEHVIVTVDFDLDGAARRAGFEVCNPTSAFHE